MPHISLHFIAFSSIMISVIKCSSLLIPLQHICVFHVRFDCVHWEKNNEQVFSHSLICLYVSGVPASLSWCWNAGDAVAFISNKGPLYIWTISGPDSGVTVHKDAHSFLSDICLFRWHPRKKGKVVFGHTDGSLSIFQPGKNMHCETENSECFFN